MSAFQTVFARIEILLQAAYDGCCKLTVNKVDKQKAPTTKNMLNELIELASFESEKYRIIIPNKSGCAVRITQSFEN